MVEWYVVSGLARTPRYPTAVAGQITGSEREESYVRETKEKGGEDERPVEDRRKPGG